MATRIWRATKIMNSSMSHGSASHDLPASAPGIQEIEEREFERLISDEPVMCDAQPLADRMDGGEMRVALPRVFGAGGRGFLRRCGGRGGSPPARRWARRVR